MPARPVSTTRRGALGGVLGLAVLAACDTDDLRPPEDGAEPTPSPTPGASETPEPDSDETLVSSVVTDLIGAAALLESARKLPRLKRPLAPLARAHGRHLVVLDADYEGVTTLPPASFTVALAEVRSTELALQVALADAAVQAQSGALARLLASMSASVSQHLAALESLG